MLASRLCCASCGMRSSHAAYWVAVHSLPSKPLPPRLPRPPLLACCCIMPAASLRCKAAPPCSGHAAAPLVCYGSCQCRWAPTRWPPLSAAAFALQATVAGCWKPCKGSPPPCWRPATPQMRCVPKPWRSCTSPTLSCGEAPREGGLLLLWAAAPCACMTCITPVAAAMWLLDYTSRAELPSLYVSWEPGSAASSIAHSRCTPHPASCTAQIADWLGELRGPDWLSELRGPACSLMRCVQH